MNKSEKLVLKFCEELLELVTVMVQDMNKEKKLNSKIISEVEDVEKQLKLIKHYFQSQK